MAKFTRLGAQVVGLAMLATAVAADGCSTNFTPESVLDSVRILAVRADQPYAVPGTQVNLDLLAFDGRATRPAPMVIYWVAQPCLNPSNDNYYACFPSFAKAFNVGTDLTPQLTTGNTFSFQMPTDVISTHSGSNGGDAYGLAVVFELACAGHVEYAPLASGAPDAVPFGCFDANGGRLGADDFVFSYALIYSFADRTNANPLIDHLTYGGATIDVATGVQNARCTVADIDNCPTTPIGTIVPASSQEPDPGASLTGQAPVKEELWVNYYVSAGKVKNDVVILYDPHGGAISGTADDVHSPQTSGEQQIWAVVHDNRGGVAWLQVPWHVQ